MMDKDHLKVIRPKTKLVRFETEIAVPDSKALKITDENFLMLLNENKMLKKKNHELNITLKKVLDEKTPF